MGSIRRRKTGINRVSWIFFLKMEGRTTYLYHHLDNIEEKILEGAESGELLEKHL